MLRKRLAAAKKDVLVAMVNMVQQRRMKGSKGDWNDFLNLRDQKKFKDSTLTDPRKRSEQVLVSFLETFTKEAHIKCLEKVLQDHFNRKAISKLNKNSAARDLKSSKLVRFTCEHPEYASSYSFSSSYDEDWVMTSMGNMSKSNKMFAVGFEMIECQDVPNVAALVKVCVVDENLEVKLDKLVNPNKSVKDLIGITYCSLPDIQISMKELLSNGAILIGHKLHCCLEALKLDHPRVIDTSLIFKRANGKRPSLRRLCKREKGAQHDCLDDARAVMKLVLGFDDQVIKEYSGEYDLSKQLLLHGIPVGLAQEELRAIFLEDSGVVLKLNDKKKRKKCYSANAVFKDQPEAHHTFRSIQGEKGVDTNGFPQKRISVRLKNGSTALIYVRKMANDDSSHSSSRKRQIEEVEPSSEEFNYKLQKKNSGDCLPELRKRDSKPSKKTTPA
ncbi:hypothetical protein MKX01_003185 [Papaver californicum]|nr:hypothetical protein MKX01_003185 [Papaver californicum]